MSNHANRTDAVDAALASHYRAEEVRRPLAITLAGFDKKARAELAAALAADRIEAKPTVNLYPLISDLEAESLPAPEWAIRDLYTVGGNVLVFGPRGTAKTFLGLGWSFAHASGESWVGRYVRKGLVVYVLAEGRGGLGIRVRAQKRHIDITGELGVYFVTTAVPLLNANEVHRLLLTIETLPEPPVLIVLDTLSRIFVGGDENSSKDMAQYVTAVDRIREATGATALTIHHTGHSTTERERGHSILGGAADTIIAVREKDDIITLTCEKQKDATEFSDIRLALKPVLNSCVLVTPEECAGVIGQRLTPKQLETLRSLRTHFLDDGATANQWKETAPVGASTFYEYRTLLVRGGYVAPDGNGRGARYRLTPAGLGQLTPSLRLTPESLRRSDGLTHSVTPGALVEGPGDRSDRSDHRSENRYEQLEREAIQGEFES